MEGEKVLSFWTEVLQLRDFVVVHCREESDRGLLRLTVAPKHEVGVCPHCGQVSDDVHQRRPREGIKDLPLGARAVELVVRVIQLWCAKCDRPFTPAWPALAEGAHATERFLEQAARLIRKGDIANAAAFFGVPEKTLEGWYYDYVERQQQKPTGQLKPIERLGIDELSLKKSTGPSSPS